MIDQASCG